jgi:hypothetical protein
VDLTIRRVPFEAPRRRYVPSRFAEFEEAIEFRVETDRPINLSEPVTLVLYVGEVMLTEGEQVGETSYTFLAFEKDRPEPGAPISLAYPNSPAEARAESGFFYEPPE